MTGMPRWLLFLMVGSVALSLGDGRTRRPRTKPGLLKKALNESDSLNEFSYGNILDAAIVLIRAAKRIGPGQIKGNMTGNATENFLNELMNEKETSGLDRIDENIEEVEGATNPKCPPKPIDCEELLQSCDYVVSGVYRIYPRSRLDTWGDGGFEVYCDMDTDGGGWTLIQKRDDYGEEADYFFKDWVSYKEGFGDLKYDYWLGNDKIFALSNQRPSSLRFDLSDFEGGNGFAIYDDFYIEDESQGYRLHIGDFRGDIGDSFKGHNNSRFTTKEKDNDRNDFQNCAKLYKGGWWYNNCHTANLNGLYLKGPHRSYADGVNWYTFSGFRYSLKKTQMKVRSERFVNPNSTMKEAPKREL